MILRNVGKGVRTAHDVTTSDIHDAIDIDHIDQCARCNFKNLALPSGKNNISRRRNRAVAEQYVRTDEERERENFSSQRFSKNTRNIAKKSGKELYQLI